jgi:uncharacterized membrane protein
VLWLTIQFAFKAPGIVAEQGTTAAIGQYLHAFIEPWGTLWFIYHLALFLVVTRLLKPIAWPIVWLAAAALEIAPIHTGSVLIDEFASRFVYFYTGYVFANLIFGLAREAEQDRITSIIGLALWGVLNGLLVFNGYADLPLVSLALGLAGAAAIVTVSALLARTRLSSPLAWLGANSIVIYLAFLPAHGGQPRRPAQDSASSPTWARSRCWSRWPASSARSCSTPPSSGPATENSCSSAPPGPASTAPTAGRTGHGRGGVALGHRRPRARSRTGSAVFPARKATAVSGRAGPARLGIGTG